MQQDYYAATAYEYQYWKTTPTPEPHHLKGNHPLEFGDYARVVPSTYLKGLHASLEHASVVEDDGLFQFNHQCIRTVTAGRAWLGILCQFGGSMLAIAGIAFLLMSLIVTLIKKYDDLSNAFLYISGTLPFSLGLLFVGVVFLLLVRLPPIFRLDFW